MRMHQFWSVVFLACALITGPMRAEAQALSCDDVFHTSRTIYEGAHHLPKQLNSTLSSIRGSLSKEDLADFNAMTREVLQSGNVRIIETNGLAEDRFVNRSWPRKIVIRWPKDPARTPEESLDRAQTLIEAMTLAKLARLDRFSSLKAYRSGIFASVNEVALATLQSTRWRQSLRENDLVPTASLLSRKPGPFAEMYMLLTGRHARRAYQHLMADQRITALATRGDFDGVHDLAARKMRVPLVIKTIFNIHQHLITLFYVAIAGSALHSMIEAHQLYQDDFANGINQETARAAEILKPILSARSSREAQKAALESLDSAVSAVSSQANTVSSGEIEFLNELRTALTPRVPQ